MSEPITEGKTFDTEDELPDDYPVHYYYLYVADGVVIQNKSLAVSVGDLKKLRGYKSVKRCDVSARNLWEYTV